MKRSFVFAAFFLFSTIVAHAQVPIIKNIPKFEFGVKAGLNYEQLNGESISKDYNAGFQGGVFASLRTSKIGVQVEGLVSFSKYSIIDSIKNGEFKATYINIPVLLEIKLINRLWLQIGPQYSGVVSVKSTNGFAGDVKSIFKSGAASGIIGAEVKLPLHLRAGARYVLGLSDLNKYGGEAWKQRIFEIHVGVAIL